MPSSGSPLRRGTGRAAEGTGRIITSAAPAPVTRKYLDPVENADLSRHFEVAADRSRSAPAAGGGRAGSGRTPGTGRVSYVSLGPVHLVRTQLQGREQVPHPAGAMKGSPPAPPGALALVRPVPARRAHCRPAGAAGSAGRTLDAADHDGVTGPCGDSAVRDRIQVPDACPPGRIVRVGGVFRQVFKPERCSPPAAAPAALGGRGPLRSLRRPGNRRAWAGPAG